MVSKELFCSNNGLVIDLELNEFRDWIYLGDRLARKRPIKMLKLKDNDYWSILDNTYEVLSEQVLKFLTKILDNPEDYEHLSAGALAQGKIHDSEKASNIFDNLYNCISSN